jgi:2-polyprenyl-6-methoxyphenol hydroxylase-like FAD-dependent oxidoreductase
MNHSARPLIVGAGPVGKGAALFLRREGVEARVIDVAEEPSRYSKALAVNPRTLEILERTGVTEKMLALGLRIQGGRVWDEDRLLAEIPLSRLEHKYPFMLGLSQATTERLLGEALEEAGGTVERGTGLVSCRDGPDGVEAVLKHSSNGAEETALYPWLLAADGAHSTTRHSLGVEFHGTSFERPWYLADLPLSTSLENDRAHVVFLRGGGFVFLVRVVNGGTRSRSRGTARRSGG